MDFTRYPVCLVCISEMGPEQTESITFTTNKIEKKRPILIYMIPTNQQSHNITARWYTLNAACASFLKLGGWMIIVFWNFPICSINFETCTCGHFNQVVFAVYSYRDTGSRFFFLVVDYFCICCQIRKQVLLARFSLKSCVFHSVQVFAIWNS